MPVVGGGVRGGYCCHCGRWLGCPYAEQSASAAIHHRLGDAEWQQWVAASVAELIASTSRLSLQSERFARAGGAYLEEVTDNNVSAAARQLQVSRRTIRDCKNGLQKPQLSSLLTFCSIYAIP